MHPDTSVSRKLSLCIVLLVVLIVGVGYADVKLAAVNTRVSATTMPIVTRWVDDRGLEQSFSTLPALGENGDSVNARHREGVLTMLRYFPCKEQIR